MTAGQNLDAVKRTLRARILADRSALSPSQIADARAEVAAQVLSRFATARNVAAYRPFRTEPCSVELLDALSAAGAQVIVPLVTEAPDLDWLPWPDGESLGIDAIAQADVVLVPALAVDQRGVRLGRGRAYYDRALARVQAGIPVVALLYDDELVYDLPAAPWDRPVSAAITPSGWHPLP